LNIKFQGGWNYQKNSSHFSLTVYIAWMQAEMLAHLQCSQLFNLHNFFIHPDVETTNTFPAHLTDAKSLALSLHVGSVENTQFCIGFLKPDSTKST
jgi:hypothetical protein